MTSTNTQSTLFIYSTSHILILRSQGLNIYYHYGIKRLKGIVKDNKGLEIKDTSGGTGDKKELDTSARADSEGEGR